MTPAAYDNLNATLAITQYYGGNAIDTTHVVGGEQDNSVSGYVGTSTLPAFVQLSTVGDGITAALDPTTGSNSVYGEGQFGFAYRETTTGPPTGNTLAEPCNPGPPASTACGDPVAFGAPYVMDPVNPMRLLAGTNRVWESKVNNVFTGGVPAGDTGWAPVSPTLVSAHCRTDYLNSINVGGVGQPGVIYTTSVCGEISRTVDGGTTWNSITGNLPPINFKNLVGIWPWVSSVTFNPWNIDEGWVTLSGQGVGHVWHTTNAYAGSATTWTDISATLPKAPVNSVVVDPRNPSTLYVGTAAAAWVCTTCGGTTPIPSWSKLGSGLPNVWVNKLTFSRDGSTLFAWTHGRGVWSVAIPDTTAQITTFPLAAGSLANEITAGPNGLWFAMRGTDQIGEINSPTGNEKVSSASSGSAPWSIAPGPDGNVWFTEFNGNKVGRVKPSGSLLEFPTLFNTPVGITSGPDRNLWVSVHTSSHVDAIDVGAHPKIGVALSGQPRGVTVGSDSNIWVDEQSAGKIARITTSGALTEFTVPGGGQTLDTLGPDGNVWFTETSGIGRVTPSGAVTEFAIGGSPIGIATGPDGNLWVASGGSIVRVHPDGTVLKTYTLPAGETAYAICTGPDGAMWFTMRGAADEIGRFNIAKG